MVGPNSGEERRKNSAQFAPRVWRIRDSLSKMAHTMLESGTIQERCAD
jgi:hypothetical protein